MANGTTECRTFIKEVKEAVKEVLQEEIKSFYVEHEQHYQDHLFIKDFREWCTGMKKTAWNSFVKLGIGILVALVIGGFILWGRSHLK